MKKTVSARLLKVQEAFHSAVAENEITYEEGVALLCSLLAGFLGDVGRVAGGNARHGAVISLSRVLSVAMDARVIILEGDLPPAPGWMSDPCLDIEERKRRIEELNAKAKKKRARKK